MKIFESFAHGGHRGRRQDSSCSMPYQHSGGTSEHCKVQFELNTALILGIPLEHKHSNKSLTLANFSIAEVLQCHGAPSHAVEAVPWFLLLLP